MHFSRQCRYRCLVWVGLCCLSIGLVAGCKDNTTEQDEVFGDAERRVREQVLPELNRESEAVLRNLVNMLTVFPEVCATPLARIREFSSLRPSLPEPLRNPGITMGDEDGEWSFTWFNVVLGDNDLTTATDSNVVPVDITMTVTFQGQDEEPLHAIPFSLNSQTDLQTVGQPPSFATRSTEGFFLYQEASTGTWTLRWRAVGGERFFSGTIIAPSGISRLIRHPGDTIPPNNTIDPAKIVASLVSDTPQDATFSETIAAGRDQGFTFYVRPGEPIQFRLRIGPNADEVRDITIDELRIGAEDAQLPANNNPGDFPLSSNVPVDGTGGPALANRGTFLWQETTAPGCPGQDQWSLRFFATPPPDSSEKFSGEFSGEVNDAAVSISSVTPVGLCTTSEPPGEQFNYTCFLGSGQIGGYDICVPEGTRVTLDAFTNDVREPSLVFVGAGRVPPPSPDPFMIRFDIELEDRTSVHRITFSDALIVLRGNDEESDLKLDPDYVSLEPPCVAGIDKRLLARLTEEGDYSTDRFEGGRFILDNVEFLADDPLQPKPRRLRRFPDRGVVHLDTSVNFEAADIRAFMDTTRFARGEIGSTMEVVIAVNRVLFTFPDEFSFFTVD